MIASHIRRKLRATNTLAYFAKKKFIAKALGSIFDKFWAKGWNNNFWGVSNQVKADKSTKNLDLPNFNKIRFTTFGKTTFCHRQSKYYFSCDTCYIGLLCTKMLVAMTLVTMTLGKTMPDITTLIFRLG
jgi:hypothetical protein